MCIRDSHIPTYNIATTDFSISREKKELLYQAGYVAASEYILKSPVFKNQLPGSTKGVLNRAKSSPTYTLFESLERLRGLPDSDKDKAFRTDEFHETVTIDRPNAEIEVIENLVNDSDHPQSELLRYIATDAPTDRGNLGYEAWFTLDGKEEKASVKIEESPDRRLFKTYIGFKGHIIQSGNAVRVRRRYRMPGSVSLNEDYWVFPLNYSQKPIGAMSMEAIFTQDPVDYGFFAHKDSGLRPVMLAGPVPRTIQNRASFVYSARFQSPAPFYLLRWRLE